MAGSSKEYKLAIRIAGEIDKSLPNSLRLTKSELRAIAKETAMASKSGNITRKLQNVSSGLEDINQVGTKVFGAIKTGAKTAAVAVGTIAAAATTVGSSFEEQMSKVEAISGSSEEQITALTDYARELGRDTAFSAREVGEGMEYMAMAGWKTQDMLDGMESVLNLASASGEDLGTTSDIVTDALTAFGYTAKDTEKFADILAQASSNANTNVALMGETFKYVGATAGAFKYSAEDVAQSIGLMANAGIKSSMAGTSLRKIMTNTNGQVVLTGKAFAKAGEDVGKYVIKTTNADGSMKSWAETTENLRKAFSKMTDTEKTQNAEAIAGKTAMSGLLAIVNASEKDYRKLKSSIRNASGAAKEMSEIRLDNLQGDVKLFKSAMDDAGIEIYDELKEPLRDVVQEGTEWVKEFTESFSYNFPTIIRKLEDAGEAIADFAEPLLDIGGWLVDNPEVLSGAIAGIGTALATYKVVSGISSLASSLSSLVGPAKGLAGAGAAVGVLVAIGTAIETANKKAKEASLEKQFGEISLSMEELQDAADEIVGKRKLQEVSDLLAQMKVSDGLYEDMEQLRKSLKRMDWKTSVGIELREEEKEEYLEKAKKFVEDAQRAIDEKGYEVELATNVLFGDSNLGSEMNLENSEFYTQLDNDAKEISGKIKDKIEKAMKGGMTVNLQKEIKRLLNQLSEITNAINEAEVDTKWEITQDKWSGKDLTPDSFRNLQKEINENIKGVTDGAEKSYQELVTNLFARKKLGYLSEDEFQKEKEKLKTAKDEQINKAYEKGLQFEWNTLMDTYGKEIETGEYSEGSKYAIREISDAMRKQIGGRNIKLKQGGDYLSNILTDISVALNGGSATNFIDDLFAPKGKESIYTTAQKDASKAANDYFSNKEGSKSVTNKGKIGATGKEDYIEKRSLSDKQIADIQEQIKYIRSNNDRFTRKELSVSSNELIDLLEQIPEGAEKDLKKTKKAIASVPKEAQKDLQEVGKYFPTFLTEPMLKATNDASTSAKKSLQEQWENIDLQSQINISGTFGMTTRALPSFMTEPQKVQKHASGGIFRTPHLGMVAEGKDAEAIIPLNHSRRSIGLFEQTKRLMGIKDEPDSLYSLSQRVYKMGETSVTKNTSNHNDGRVIHFSPNITIKGNVNKEEINKAMEMSFEKFEQMMKRYEKKKKRVSFT